MDQLFLLIRVNQHHSPRSRVKHNSRDCSGKLITPQFKPFHKFTLAVHTQQVYEFPSLTPVSISSFSEDTEKEQFIINTGELLRPGGVYRLYIEFTAPVSNQLLVGLYLSNYTSDNGETRYLATTDLEATDARRVFPCFDEPDLKATFDISVLRLPHYHSLSNMDLLSTEDV